MKTKTCNKCGLTVSLEEAKTLFIKHSGCTDGIRPMCIECKRKDETAYRLKNRKDPEFKEKERKWNRARRLKYYKENIVKILKYLKLEKPTCSKCGYIDNSFAPFDFHHLNPDEKEFGIHKKIDSSPFEKWKAEIDKCILVCSNCHRKIHEKRLSNNE